MEREEPEWELREPNKMEPYEPKSELLEPKSVFEYGKIQFLKTV